MSSHRPDHDTPAVRRGGVSGLSPRRKAQLVALGLAVVAAVVLLLVPIGTVSTETVSSDGLEATQEVEATWLWREEGWWAIGLLLVPVVATLVPFLAGRRDPLWLAAVSAGLLGLFVILGLLTLGIFFVPAFIAAVVAVARPGAPRPT